MILIPLFGAYSTLLIIAAAHDVATRTIPNSIPVLLILAALGIRLMLGDVFTGIGLGLAVFTAMLLLWLRRLVGGGDVKLAAVAAVAIPVNLIATFVLAVAIAGGIVAVVYLALSLLVRRPLPGRRRGLLRRLGKAEAWRISRRGPIPYAVAIAFGSLAVLIPTFSIDLSR